MSRFIPSKYQKEIFKTYRETNKNIVISAVPGSGKTTTILELLKFTPITRKAIFLAFNKSIVEELSKKVPDKIDVMTLHSLGCKSLFRYYRGQVDVQQYKLFRIAKKIEKSFEVDKKKIDAYIFNLIKIIDLYRLRLESSLDAIDSIISYYGIDTIGNEIQDAKKLFIAYQHYNENWRSEGKKFSIDFVDMVYLPAIKNYRLPIYSDVFIDESQDLNAAQQKLVEKIIDPVNGRFVSVGDPRQSIYGFMSADAEAYQKFVEKPNTVELKLSYCYRCGTEIVKAANKIWDVIESPDNMFSGEVIEKGNFKLAKEGDFILCRNTKPLVELYFKLIKEEKTCYIKGSEIGKSIINLVKNLSKVPKDTMIQYLYDMLSNLHSELLEKGVRSPTKHPRYISLTEKIDIIKIIAEKFSTTNAIIKCIERMFKDISKGIMLSTIHKSKGLETENVFILDLHLIPSEYAVKRHQIIQEHNLLYVAITRAKKKLYFI